MDSWKDIPGYEGIYQASTTGKIRTKPGKVTSNKRYGHRVWQTRILKQKIQQNRKRKDPRVNLWKDGNCKTFLVSRLVAMTWVCGYEHGLTVNHIDGNPMNNHCENLEWVSISDNIRKGYDTGLFANCQNPIHLLCDEGTLIFESMAAASRFLGRNSGYVSNNIKINRPITATDGKEYIIKDVAS